MTIKWMIETRERIAALDCAIARFSWERDELAIALEKEERAQEDYVDESDKDYV